MRRLLLLVLPFVLSACPFDGPSSTTDAGPRGDDAGVDRDASVERDGGAPDAGARVDAGPPLVEVDAGPGPQDAGWIGDAGCALVTAFEDADGDGYGTSSATVCVGTPGYASEGGDCDDARLDVHPTAPDVCDGADNDCDGTADPICWCPARFRSGREYRFCVSELVRGSDYATARATCMSAGMDLAVLTTSEETQFVAREMAELLREDADLLRAWIGLNDLASEGTFTWVDGTPMIFERFRAGQPDGGTAENCVSMLAEGPDWVDAPCLSTAGFLCESI